MSVLDQVTHFPLPLFLSLNANPEVIVADDKRTIPNPYTIQTRYDEYEIETDLCGPKDESFQMMIIWCTFPLSHIFIVQEE